MAFPSLPSVLHLIPLYIFDIAILMCGVRELQVAAYTTFGVMNLYKVTLLACHTKLKYNVL